MPEMAHLSPGHIFCISDSCICACVFENQGGVALCLESWKRWISFCSLSLSLLVGLIPQHRAGWRAEWVLLDKSVQGQLRPSQQLYTSLRLHQTQPLQPVVHPQLACDHSPATSGQCALVAKQPLWSWTAIPCCAHPPSQRGALHPFPQLLFSSKLMANWPEV